MEGGVPLLGPPVQGARVLDDEVHDVKGAASLLGDSEVEKRLGKFLKIKNLLINLQTKIN